ncbi:MAG: macro domain-containing protein [Erysipelotrichaceae bacterium]|nr:macro domain-containing protein [Erysipelotrichaceae bacterium]
MENSIKLINTSCVNENIDVVVNAANRILLEGGGVCGAIFAKAGSIELAKACGKYDTPLKDGSAVITPSFGITNAKAIIHAVGPNFSVTPTAFKELFDAYYNSLLVMKENGYHSIAFPLISSGIFGGNLADPVGESAKQCLRAYKKFISDYPEYGVELRLCSYGSNNYALAEKEFRN